jgi:diguanylate cyclase (GGDEF)-like protein
MALNAFPVYLFAFLILLIIYISLKRQVETYLTNTRLYRLILLMAMALLVSDFLSVFFDGMAGGFVRFLILGTTVIQYACAAIMILLWIDYVVFFLFKDSAQIVKINRWLLILMIPYLVFVILSCFGDFIFFIDSANVYHRGSFFWVYLLIMFSYLLFGMGIVIAYRKVTRKSHFFPLLMFAVPAAVGGILQVVFYGLLLVWPMTAVSLFMIYVFVQSERINTDYLTELFNKREYDSYLMAISRNKPRKQKLIGFTADLDHFKMINDQYGHDTGDLVLKAMANLLRHSFGKNDLIARTGGDEFAVLFWLSPEEAPEPAIARLKTAVEDFNKTKQFPFDLSFSFGMDVFDPKRHDSLKDFVRHLDELMYLDKANTAGSGKD